jgi:chromate transporter
MAAADVDQLSNAGKIIGGKDGRYCVPSNRLHSRVERMSGLRIAFHEGEHAVEARELGQILPGVNSTNLTIYVGQHLRGAIGAAVTLGGLLSGPFVVVIAVGTLYRTLLGIPGFQAAMAGVAAVAVGMLLRLGIVFARRVKRRVVPGLIMLATFLAVGILNWPLVAVVLALAPLSIAAAWPRPSSHA